MRIKEQQKEDEEKDKRGTFT